MHKGKVLAVFGTVALAVGWLTLSTPAAEFPFPKDTIFATNTDTTENDVLFKVSPDGEAEVFATLAPGLPEGERRWFGPIGFGPNGHLYVVSKGGNGTLWDATAGGDLSDAKPVATGLFVTAPSKMTGLAFDAAGNAYVASGERGRQPIVRVAPDGKTSALPVFDRPRGLAVLKNAEDKEILYIAEGGSGNILTYNLTDDKPGEKPLATGFVRVNDHQPGSMIVDRRGRVLVLWKMDADDSRSGAVFDITEGGDFSSKEPVLDLEGAIRMDVNQMAVDSNNNLYIAGANSDTLFISRFADGEWGPVEDFAYGLGDHEAVAISP